MCSGAPRFLRGFCPEIDVFCASKYHMRYSSYDPRVIANFLLILRDRTVSQAIWATDKKAELVKELGKSTTSVMQKIILEI
jgi:hypothetical protein